MNPPDRAALRDALVRAGEGWVFQFWGDRSDAELDRLIGELGRFADEYDLRYGERPDPFGLLTANPVKGAAFFQIDTLRLTPEMQCAVWRILLGADIRSL